MSVQLDNTTLHLLTLRTRMPFRYGIASMAELPHLFLRAEFKIDGERQLGVAADGLSPRWFLKDDRLSILEERDAMLEVIRAACEHGRSIGEMPSVFELWFHLYADQLRWASDRGYPPLLAGFGVSLVERAAIDAFCRTHGLSFGDALRTNAFGIDLEALHGELAECQLASLLPERPLRSLVVRHTVGLGDPLTQREIPPGERVDDQLPQALEECIRAYGLTHFKVKLSGHPDEDVKRLRQVVGVIETNAGDGWVFTLDGNEQYASVRSFRAFWEALEGDTRLSLESRLLFVEQPFGRQRALSVETERELSSWAGRPPLVIDESDAEIGSLRRALDCGYAGTSTKNCKGVIKGVANACLLERRRRAEGHSYILSAEDLSTVGPVSLLQDLAVVASLGIEHVERNGHHYFAGLSMFPSEVQEGILTHHDDLYRCHPLGFPTLRIDGGRIEVGTVVDAAFGLQADFDPARVGRAVGRGVFFS